MKYKELLKEFKSLDDSKVIIVHLKDNRGVMLDNDDALYLNSDVIQFDINYQTETNTLLINVNEIDDFIVIDKREVVAVTLMQILSCGD